MTRGGKILLWASGLLSFGLFGLWALGRFSEAGTLVIAKERALAITGALPEFGIEKSTGPITLPEAKDSAAVAKNLLVELVALKKSGNSTPESRNALVNKLYTEASLEKPFSFTPYTLADLNITADSQEAKNKYQKEFLAVMKGYYYAGLGDEVEIWIKSRGGNQAEKEKGEAALLKGNKSYQKITEGLKNIAVPKEFAEAHLKALNIFKSLALATEELAKSQDIVSSLPVIQFFYESLLKK